MNGEMELIGSGMVRDVYVAEHLGRKVAVKTLRYVDGVQRQLTHIRMHEWELLALDAVSRGVVSVALPRVGPTCPAQLLSRPFLDTKRRSAQHDSAYTAHAHRVR